MINVSLQQIVPVVQMAIGPTILISGVGLFLLMVNNRFGRTIDRARALAETVPASAAAEAQIGIIWRRARIIRVTMTLGALSVLFAALLIIVLFLTALLEASVGLLVMFLFLACLLSLIGAAVGLVLDLNLSLAALRLELKER